MAPRRFPSEGQCMRTTSSSLSSLPSSWQLSSSPALSIHPLSVTAIDPCGLIEIRAETYRSTGTSVNIVPATVR
jgi:hypothetical protein